MVDTGADLHHQVRHDWLARLLQLQRDTDELLASGRLVAGVHRRCSTRSKDGMHIDIETSFGRYLLYEVEAFRAEEFSSLKEARGLIGECASIALADAESQLEKTIEVALHPEWLPELAEALRNVHLRTVTSLKSKAAQVTPVPPYRWRLPAHVHAGMWNELNGRWLSDTSRRGVSAVGSYDYEDLINELRTRGMHRVHLLHHPTFPDLSCETDVVLLTKLRFDWIQLADAYLTCDTFDWLVDLTALYEWKAYGWSAHHR